MIHMIHMVHMGIFPAVLYILGSYLLGAIPTSAIIAKIVGGGIDLSKEGSGNLGATNVARVIGKKFGVITLILDALKGYIPVFFALNLFHLKGLLLIFVLIAPIVGHCYSVYVKFKGGKGVATGLGIFLAVSPKAVLIAFAIFLAIIAISKIVSLSSIVSAFFMPFIIFYVTKDIYYFSAAILISGLIIFKHYGNIKRILSGTEKTLFR